MEKETRLNPQDNSDQADRLLQEFRAGLHGEVILPGDLAYDTARRLYNAMIDRRPRMIVRCDDASDVIDAIQFARQQGLTVAVRGGGHSASGMGSAEDGLVIDLSGLKAIIVDPVARTARVGGGCTWGEVDRATHTHGLAAPSGLVSTTGVGGLTLGGGTGHLTRRYGLTIDNLLEAGVVLADGSRVKASPEENPDLFWALRGGGGNFGVVTDFLFRLHPINEVVAGPMLWPMERAAEVMRFYREFIRDAPEDISGFLAFLTVPPVEPFPESLRLKKMCAIVWCYTGPMEKADEVFEWIRQSGTPALDLVRRMTFPALQSMFDPTAPPGMQNYWRADFVNELSDAAIPLYVKYAAQMPTPLSMIHLYPINGAAQLVPKQDTAFSYRAANFSLIIAGLDADPANNPALIAWVKDAWQALHPYSAGGAYVNFLMDEPPERVKLAYGDNYTRLAEIKRKYDPDNFFRVNQNILPA